MQLLCTNKHTQVTNALLAYYLFQEFKYTGKYKFIQKKKTVAPKITIF